MAQGLRNNNPGNIRRSGVRYKGEVDPPQDAAFKQFRSMAWGYRAMFVLLDTYRLRHGLNTLPEMISRWAPPVENDTGAYAVAVSRWAGVGQDEVLDTRSRDRMLPIVAAMSRMENGMEANMKDVEKGWELFVG